MKYGLLATVWLLWAPAALAQTLDTIQFGGTYYSVLENSGFVSIELQRTGAMTDFGDVRVQTVPRTAFAFDDFEYFNDTVTFEPGQSNLTLRINIQNDSFGENMEYFEVILSDPDPFCCQLGRDTTATVTIEDNDLGVQFGSPFYAVAENAGELLVQVSRFGDLTNESGQLSFAIINDTAIRNEHFSIASNVVTFAPGQTNAFIRVAILNNAVPDGLKQFRLVFEPNPDPFCCSLGNTVATWINIEENDRGVEFSAATYPVWEDANQVLITITRGGDLINTDGHVAFNIYDDSARALIDYEVPFADRGFLFSAGRSNWSFAINILNDALMEGSKRFSLSLIADEFNLPLGDQRWTEVLIFDNDFGVEFSEVNSEVAEQGGGRQIHLQRIGDPTNAFTVDLIAGGTATLGADYVLPSTRLYFGAGQTNLALVIPVLDDPLVEGPEVMELTLINPTGDVLLGTHLTTRIYINDNEFPVSMVDQSFELWPSGVTAALVQTNGKILVASPLSLLNQDGTFEKNFDPQIYGIYALALQADGKVLCAGNFGVYVGVNYQYHLTRYDRSGARDVGFVSPLSYSSSVRCIQPQPDGRILVGGEIFSSIGTPFKGIVRLNYWGDWDGGFGVATDIWRVDAILLQADGMIVIGGPFESVGGSPHAGIARLFDDGWPDDSFDAYLAPGSAVSALAMQPDGNLLAVVGSNRVVRLSGVDGAVDISFQSQLGTNSAIQSMTLQPDGKILLLGDIFGADNNLLGAIARLNSDGSVDDTFASFEGNAFIAWHEGRVFTAHNGNLVRLLPVTPASGFSFTSNQFYALEGQRQTAVTVQRHGNSSSSLAVDFAAAGTARVGEDYLPGSGTILFSPLETAKSIVTEIIDDCQAESNEVLQIRLTNPAPGAVISPLGQASLLIADDDAPGSLDTFSPNLDWITLPNFTFYAVHSTAIALQPDGKIIVARDGVLTRVNSDGARDPAFADGVTICGQGGGRGFLFGACSVSTIVLEPDSDILAGGFGSVIRTDRNGVVDSNFVVRVWSFFGHGGGPGFINQLVVQPDGKIVVFGSWTSINGVFRNPARLNPDSTLDTSFTPEAAGYTHSVLLPNGKLVAAGWGGLRRLNADGRKDASFREVAVDGAIHGLAIGSDQKVLIGGAFAKVTDDSGLLVEHPPLARFHPDGALDVDFHPTVVIDNWGQMTEIHALTYAKDGSIFLAASFSNGTIRFLKLDSEGRLIARFNSAWFSDLSRVNQIIEHSNDGKLLVAGTFETVNSVPRPGVARLVSERSHIQLAPPALQADGSLRIVAGSHAGESYVLQKSSDMNEWAVISTNTAVDCTLELIDPAPSPQRGFYRVMKID
jgi:uncharacterized delta-60 repeat protein